MFTVIGRREVFVMVRASALLPATGTVPKSKPVGEISSPP